MKLSKIEVDIIERALWTAVQAFFAYVAVSGINSAKDWQAGAIAGVGAGFSVVKGIIATRIGNTDSASTTTVV